ncbi:MAG: hypothetical protein MR878_04400 [Campylobacter sp.]|uniref:hypothetical protein n=1 Tax=Campylobacter sp. TaxID=205 RepID=UPI002AA75419|nr:hypothetical protein [Campylobacter sp.]MCI7014610.1 hypothetical protein [Campylobacter sp.]
MAENFGALISEIEKLENSVLANNLKELENTLAGINDNDFRFVNGLELLTDLIIEKNIIESDGTANTFDDKESKIEYFASTDSLGRDHYSLFTRYKNPHGICRSFSRVQKVFEDALRAFTLISIGSVSHLKDYINDLRISNNIFDSSTFDNDVENKQAYLCISVRELPYDMKIKLDDHDKNSLLEAVFGEQNLEFTIPEDKITDEIKSQFERYKDFFASVADKVEKHLDALDDTIAKNKNDFKSFSEDDMAVVLSAMSFNNTIKKLIRERRAIHNQNTSREIKRIMNYILDQIVE